MKKFTDLASSAFHFLAFYLEISDLVTAYLAKSFRSGILTHRIKAEVKMLREEVKNGN